MTQAYLNRHTSDTGSAIIPGNDQLVRTVGDASCGSSDGSIGPVAFRYCHGHTADGYSSLEAAETVVPGDDLGFCTAYTIVSRVRHDLGSHRGNLDATRASRHVGTAANTIVSHIHAMDPGRS